MTEATEHTNKVTTGVKFPVRVSYFKSILGKKIFKEGKDTGKMDFGTMILIPKEDEITNNEIKKTINRLAKDKYPTGAPKGLKISYRDGDVGPDTRGGVPDTCNAASEEPYGGNHFINLTADRRPYIFDVHGRCVSHDKNGAPQEVPADLIVSGDYVIVEMKCYTWGPGEFGQGISWGLKSIQQYRKGEPLGSPENAGPSFKPLDLSGDSGDKPEEKTDNPDDIMALV